MNTWKAILAALVIFGAGFVTGNVLNRVSEHTKAVTPNPPRNPGHPQGTIPLDQLRRLELMGRVQKDLDLSSDQRARIEKIIGDGQDRIHELWDQVAPDIHDEYEDVKKKFCDVLTADQKKRFEDLMKQQLHPHKPATTNAPPQAACEQKKSDV